MVKGVTVRQGFADVLDSRWDSVTPQDIAVLMYGPYMAAKKVTFSLPEELVEALAAAAGADGVPLSRLVVSAVENELRRRAGRQLMAEWQAEHGAFSVEELAAARAEMAAADAEALEIYGPPAS